MKVRPPIKLGMSVLYDMCYSRYIACFARTAYNLCYYTHIKLCKLLNSKYIRI